MAASQAKQAKEAKEAKPRHKLANDMTGDEAIHAGLSQVRAPIIAL